MSRIKRDLLVRVYGVDTPRAGESVLRLDVTYRVRGWGHDGIEYGVDWNALTNDERIELDRLLWKSREKARQLAVAASSDAPVEHDPR